MPARRTFAPEILLEARRKYDAGLPQQTVAKCLGITTQTLRKYMKEWQWPARFDGKPVHQVQGLASVSVTQDPGSIIGQGADAPAVDTKVLAQRVEAEVRQELSQIGQRLGSGTDPAEAERNARVLASLVKSLNELAKLDAARLANARRAGSEGQCGENDGESPDPYDTDLPPRDLAALRSELAARLERMQQDRCGGSAPG